MELNKEKQIEEMAEAIFQNCNCGLFFSEAEKIAKFVIEEQGYRKTSDIAMEIFEEIDNILDYLKIFNSCDDILNAIIYRIVKIKKKYTEEGK